MTANRMDWPQRCSLGRASGKETSPALVYKAEPGPACKKTHCQLTIKLHPVSAQGAWKSLSPRET